MRKELHEIQHAWSRHLIVVQLKAKDILEQNGYHFVIEFLNVFITEIEFS